MDTLSPSTLQQSLPLFYQQFSFYVSLITATISLVLLIRGITNANKVEIHLKKDAFYRIAPFGESLYAHFVAISFNESSLIRNAYATLSKTSGSNKKFNLKINFVGSPDDKGLFGDYKLTSTSPLDIFEKDKTRNSLFVFVFSEYSDKIQLVHNKFSDEVLKIKPQMEEAGEDQAKKTPLFIELFKLQQLASTEIMEHIQIEEGEYNLTLFVEYEKRMKHIPHKQTIKTSSSIKFQVDSKARSQMPELIKSYLNTLTFQLLTGQATNAPLPTYKFINVEEVQ